MNRRQFIALLGGAAAWPLAARAQNSGKIVRIGMLTTANPRSASFGAKAIFVLESASIFQQHTQLAQLAMKTRLPTSFAFREYVEAGGLVSYGVSFSTMYRRAAELADRILRGTKPTDLPVEQSTKFELVINLKTAKALGVDIPISMQLLADEVIE